MGSIGMDRDLRALGEDHDFFVVCFRRLRTFLQERCCCRECGAPSSLFANVCETCGTQDPIRLPLAWAIFAAGVCAAVLALRVWVL